MGIMSNLYGQQAYYHSFASPKQPPAVNVVKTHEEEGLSDGAIIGIVIGLLVCLIVVMVIIMYCKGMFGGPRQPAGKPSPKVLKRMNDQQDILKRLWIDDELDCPGIDTMEKLVFPPFFGKSKYKFNSEFNKAYDTFSSILACYLDKDKATLDWTSMSTNFRAWASDVEIKCRQFKDPRVRMCFRVESYRLFTETSTWANLYCFCQSILRTKGVQTRLTAAHIKSLDEISLQAHRNFTAFRKRAEDLEEKTPDTYIARDAYDDNMNHNNKLLMHLFNNGELDFTPKPVG